jgi:cob(I)alamin adenosyltransferase
VKIYTKGGDSGETSLIGGDRVKKNHPRLEAYGNADELSSWLGLLREMNIDIYYKKLLLDIQDRIFTLESLLAAPEEQDRKNLPSLSANDISRLEREIDLMNNSLPPLTSFIIPGGSQTVAFCHIARTVCRRTERSTISLAENHDVPAIIIQYLNRLSDLLFVLARTISKTENSTETLWKAKR